MSTGRRLTSLTGGIRVMRWPGWGRDDAELLCRPLLDEDDFLPTTSSGKCCRYTDTQNLKTT